MALTIIVQRVTTNFRIDQLHRLHLLACFMILLFVAPVAKAGDTDSDGLLDLMDVPGFPERGSSYESLGVKDLDGANQLSSLTELCLDDNQITSIEAGDFEGLSSLTSLRLTENPITELNLSQASLQSLADFYSSNLVTSLWLDDALLSDNSFSVVLSGTRRSIGYASLVGLRFSGEKPQDLSKLLSIENLGILIVDQSLFDTYADELNAFASDAGRVLSVVYYGDSNRDGKFNSSDLVTVFAAGEYEDDIAGNSYWTEGDWNSDGDFDTADLVVAFAGGRYEQEAVIKAVPEPSSFALLALSLLALLGCRSSKLKAKSCRLLLANDLLLRDG